MSHNSSRICPYYLNNRCRFGNFCNYSHNLNQEYVPQRSNRTCRAFLRGNCRFGQNCKYFHPQEHQPFNGRTEYNPSKGIGISSRNRFNNFTLSPDAKPFIPRNISKNCDSLYVGTSTKGSKKQGDNEPFCPYYEETGQCEYKNQGDCPLIHGLYCELCCRYCLNPFDAQQQKEHKRDCVAEHERQMKQAFANQLSREKTCGICMENIWEQAQRFGILNKCKHSYCLVCIRSWRKTTGPVKEATRSCPQCRVVSDFVIPSELWVEDDIEKEALIKQYQKNMKQKVCKYVKNDNADDCPFGNKCFYRHQRRDGTIIQSGPPRRRRHRSPSHYQNLSLEEFIRIVPNVNLIRVGIGEEDSLSYLFDEFQDIFDDFRYDYTTDEDDDVDDDLDALDDELFGLHLDDNID